MEVADPTGAQAAKKQTDLVRLFYSVGYVTVLCGLLEHELRRVLLYITDRKPSDMQAIIMLGWEALWKDIGNALGGPKAAGLAEILERHNFEVIRDSRNAIIHGRIDTRGAPDLQLSRKTKTRSFTLLGTYDDTIAMGTRVRDLTVDLLDWLPASAGWGKGFTVREDWGEAEPPPGW